MLLRSRSQGRLLSGAAISHHPVLEAMAKGTKGPDLGRGLPPNTPTPVSWRT